MTHWRDTLTADEAAELLKLVRWYKTHPADCVKDRLFLKMMNSLDALTAAQRLNAPPHVTPFLKE